MLSRGTLPGKRKNRSKQSRKTLDLAPEAHPQKKKGPLGKERRSHFRGGHHRACTARPEKGPGVIGENLTISSERSNQMTKTRDCRHGESPPSGRVFSRHAKTHRGEKRNERGRGRAEAFKKTYQSREFECRLGGGKKPGTGSKLEKGKFTGAYRGAAQTGRGGT